MIGSPSKKIWANRSVRADWAKSWQFRDPDVINDGIGYEVDLNELAKP